MLTIIISTASKAHCVVFRTIKELEKVALDALKTAITSALLYHVGPAIPYSSNIGGNPKVDVTTKSLDYMKWLDTQQESSVLYFSFGTFLSPSDAQIDELATGLRESGVPFLWVARDQVSHLSEILGDKGKVVSWCDQMRVLSHSSVGGFLTHCGWNSALEAAFAGVPALTFPLGIDQTLHSKLMVEDWGVGWRVKKTFQDRVTRKEITFILKKFMNLENGERKELEGKCKELKDLILLGVGEDGSISNQLDEFLSWMSCKA